MNFTYVLFGLLFIAGGLLFSKGKLFDFISAFRQLPEKERLRVRSLCLNVGEMIVLNGLIFLLKGLPVGLGDSGFTIAIAAWMIVAAFDVMYISKKHKEVENQ